jgi:hypothetical protein
MRCWSCLADLVEIDAIWKKDICPISKFAEGKVKIRQRKPPAKCSRYGYDSKDSPKGTLCRYHLIPPLLGRKFGSHVTVVVYITNVRTSVLRDAWTQRGAQLTTRIIRAIPFAV